MKTVIVNLGLLISIGILPGSLSGQQLCERSGRYYDSLFSVTRTPNVVYGGNFRFNGNWQDLLLDVYTPDNDVDQNRPLIVLAHQGAFIIGDKFAFNAAMGRLAERLAALGYVTASINYRLGMPNILNITDDDARAAIYRGTQDMRAAVRFFRRDVTENGNTFGIDSSLVVVGGSSAGAIMALHTTYMDSEDETASQIDTTGLGPLAGSSGNPGYSSDVTAAVNLAGAILDTSFVQTGDQPLFSAHAPDDGVVPYTTEAISFSDSVLIAHGSLSIHNRLDRLGISDSLYTFLGGAGHIPFSPNDTDGMAYLDTVFTEVRDFLFDNVICTTVLDTESPVIDDSNLSVYPVPTRHTLTIVRSPVYTRREIKIYDMTGREVRRFHFEPGMRRAVVRLDLSAGVYLLHSNDESVPIVIIP